MMGLSKAAMIAGALLTMFGAMPASAVDTVYVIRHMQKADGADPALTAEGSAGAAALSNRLADKKVTAIYATPTRRAMETALPLAKRLGLSVMAYDPGNPAGLVKAAQAATGAVLIVGHSNTVPDLVASFGGARPAAIGDDEFGTLYIVHPGSSAVEQVHIAAHAH